MNDLLDLLQAMAAKQGEVDNPLELFLDMAQRVVKYASAEFGTKPDEIAILMMTADGKHLRFAAPRKFADLGTIPITKRDSIAVNILAKKAGEAMNNVPMVKHVSFFESIKLRDKVVADPEDDHGAHRPRRRRRWAWPRSAARARPRPKPGPTSRRPTSKRAEELFAAVAPFLAAARPEKF